MEGIQTRRRNAQNKFWLILIVLSIMAIVYLLYKPSQKKSAQGAPSKVVTPQKQTIIQKVQAVFQDPTDYRDYDYSTTDMFSMDNWQDRMDRPHYLAWDDDYSTTPGAQDLLEEEANVDKVEEPAGKVDIKEEVEKETEKVQVPEEKKEVAAEKKDEWDVAKSGQVEKTDTVGKTVGTEKTGPAAAAAGDQNKQIPPPSSNSDDGLMDKLKDLKTKFDVISSDFSLMKATDPLQIKNIEFITSYTNPCFNDKASNFRCLPAFFIAGMPRCETKALHNILARHPAITAPDAHSPTFWTGSDQIPMEKYLDHFKQPSLTIKSLATKGSTKDSYKALTFDSNPSLFWKGAVTSTDAFMTPLHLKHVLPNSKIVIIVRDPIDRLYSEYMTLVPTGTAETFHTFVETSVQAFKKCEVDVKRLFTCIHRDLGDDSKPHLETGMYYLFYQEWIKSFTAAHILVIRMEDFDANKEFTVKAVLYFLQVEDTSDTVIKDMLKDDTKPLEKFPPMQDRTRKNLYAFYQPYNQQFATLLNNDALKYIRKDI